MAHSECIENGSRARYIYLFSGTIEHGETDCILYVQTLQKGNTLYMHIAYLSGFRGEDTGDLWNIYKGPITLILWILFYYYGEALFIWSNLDPY
jgi:hypothetical protein